MADEKTKQEKQTQAASSQNMPNGDTIVLPAGAAKVAPIAAVIGLTLIALAYFLSDTAQFQHSYLTAFMWALSIGVGGVWWVMIQHLLGARASVVMRRVGELIATSVTIMGILLLPIVLPAVLGHDTTLYQWVDHHYMEGNHALHAKTPYLNPAFFIGRMVFYFVFWSLASQFWLKRSFKQDNEPNDVTLMRKLQGQAAPGLILFTIAVTFCAIDLLMSMDALWFSTIFGVYYFSTCVITFHCTLALILMWLQKRGVLAKSVNKEHFHDVGKMMFAFTCFWAYVAFSQFMLIWYANIPEESHWYHDRFEGTWVNASMILAAVHFVIPFFGMMSRYMKRNTKWLRFWAVYLLIVCWFDMYWMVAPNLHTQGLQFTFADFATWIGMAALVISVIIFRMRNKSLVVTGDPRLKRSLAFENI
jgi:hypothetical protein